MKANVPPRPTRSVQADEALGRVAAEPARPACAVADGVGIGQTAQVAGRHGLPVVARAADRRLVAALAGHRRLDGAAGPARCRRRHHAFPSDERRAFNRLLDLGARLEANFTADDLRREYRRLAQLYHPDCHNGGSAVEQGSLARTFADLTERYRCLRAFVEPRH